MKKRLGIILLTMLMCFGGGLQAYAQTEAEEYVEIEATVLEDDDFEGIAPLWQDIIYMDMTLNIDRNGYGSWDCYVNTSSSTKITCIMRLQKQNGSSWSTVTTHTETKNAKSALFYDSKSGLDTSANYRVEYIVTATYPGGSETVTEYMYY